MEKGERGGSQMYSRWQDQVRGRSFWPDRPVEDCPKVEGRSNQIEAEDGVQVGWAIGVVPGA